ncbi:MAG: hypothetical protein K2Q10_08730, partial [Rhodospirillales bacterium]|nr:hypothetical protein [Rhodospirillales bacterium]
EQLLSRRESARISQAVETSADKIQFRVVSPPFLPSIPSGPPRMVLLSAVLVAAFGVGTGAALLLGRTEDTVSRIEALESFGLPVYGGVSLVETVEQRARRAMDGALLVTGVVTLVLIYGFLMIYAHDLGALARAAQQFLPSLTEMLNHG